MSNRLDLLDAQLPASEAMPIGVEGTSNARSGARRKTKRRGGRRAAAAAAVHGRESIGSVSSTLYKAFRERFLSGNASTSKVGDYRELRQRDAESGQHLDVVADAESVGEESDSGSRLSSSSSSSVEDLFVHETRRKWRRKGSGRGSSRQRLKNPPLCTRKTLAVIVFTFLALLVLTLISILGIYVLRVENLHRPSTLRSIDLTEVIYGAFYANEFNGSWTKDGNVLYKDEEAIVEYNTKTQQRTILSRNAHQYFHYEKSADGKYLLLAKSRQKIFRYSFFALYDILNLKTGLLTPLTIEKERPFLTLVKWAPMGNGLIINYENNIYYKPRAFAQEIVITRDSNTMVLNGIPDWVYEEEVFSSNEAMWFNTAGTQLAFIRFDDSLTRFMDMPVYGEANDLSFQYPEHRQTPYPKVGTPNPRVQLFVANLENAMGGRKFLSEVQVPTRLQSGTDHIISVVSWLNETHVLSTWMNRTQNAAYVMCFDGLSNKMLYNIESKTGWINIFSPPFSNNDSTRIALILPYNNYKHITLLSTKANASEQQHPVALTEGNFVVDSILHWDPTHDLIFYLANTAEHSEQLHLYAIKAQSGGKEEPKCVTCKLMSSDNEEQNYFSATFNNQKQIVITSLGPGLPATAIYEWSYENFQLSLTKLLDWETNDMLRSKLEGVTLPRREIHTFDIGEGLTAKVLLHLPPNLDRSGRTKYPMLVDVYGGPDSFYVNNKWSIDWGSYLCINESVIYAKIDGRGSGMRGEKLLNAIYRNLGTVEIQDQISVTRKVTQKFNFVDALSIGIWGWSYGGYAAGMALATDDSKVFTCAASVAPVTDWNYYDSIYTERYMGLPSENEAGYENSRLWTRADQFRGKKYMLVHGTLDDNVHYQQAMALAKNLELRDISFTQISYPDEQHGLIHVRPHLYHALNRFFGDCFGNKHLMESGK
ncbi:venom dipeptidyl peptidase 4-like [Scaptodrosophila lebanonensis]|uniref:Venom dipeptidyl peptidase 4 n=1 Tax=Drosophila lebanonensis TaxID=7225 RepID=A0A6J2UGK6_DROLE|nr:venom dipeptidyl peptidase 4-like [Scaptodrosophila lebanonensis]